MSEVAFGSQLRFGALVARPDHEISLAEGALLIGDIAYPELDHHRYHVMLDRLAREVVGELRATAPYALLPTRQHERLVAERVLCTMRDVLQGREGFHGNEQDYYSPSNSYLNVALDTRTGLPITLSIVYVEVARRLRLPLVGVGLPAHFMAKWPLPDAEGGDLYLDAFNNARILDTTMCQRFVMRLMRSGGARALAFDPRWMRPIGPRAIYTRMLTNLKLIYLRRQETQLALEAIERLLVLNPTNPEELRDRGLLRLAMGDPLLAAADIAAYATRAPEAPDLGRLKRRVLALREVRAKLN